MKIDFETKSDEKPTHNNLNNHSAQYIFMVKQSDKFCKNCGAYIVNADQFCPDCGKEIPASKHAIRYCPNCGERILGSEYFCKNCGRKIKEPEKEKTGFLDRHKTLIIIIIVIAAIALVAVGAFTSLMPSPSQEVEVDTFTFNIPQDFMIDDDSTVRESDGGVIYASKYWQNGEDEISIDVMYDQSGNADIDEVARELGGDYQNLMGYDGYFSNLTDYYSFTFTKDGKLITVYATDTALFDEIEVL